MLPNLVLRFTDPRSEAAEAEIMSRGWTFITNHGLVLSYLDHHPSHTAREIADNVGITERTTHKIISDLEAAGYIELRKKGRRNIYSVSTAAGLKKGPSLPVTKRQSWRLAVSLVGAVGVGS